MEVLFDVVDKYGIWGALGLVGIMGLFLLFKWLSNKLSNDMTSGLEKVGEKLTDQLSAQNESLTKTIVEQQSKMLDHLLKIDNDNTKRHDGMLNERFELAGEINDSLRDIMNIHNAQRAFIIEFHNSYRNLTGVPFAKYSCTYEWFEKGLMPLANKCKALPFSQMAKVVNDMIMTSNQQLLITDLDKMEEENPSLFAFLKDTRTKAVVYTAMYDKFNNLIGCLVLEFQVPLEQAHLNLDQLRVQTVELTSVLNIRYKYMETEDED